MEERIQVSIRARPGPCPDAVQLTVRLTQTNSVRVPTSQYLVSGRFSRVFDAAATQADVFDFVSSAVLATLDGFNCTLFAYGQTGSGKTYTMFGDPPTFANAPGVVPNALQALHARVPQLQLSFLQIYNEVVTDLLAGSRRPLKLRENSSAGVYIEGLRVLTLKSADQSLAMLRIGMKNREVKKTALNDRSSRSHTILQVSVDKAKANFCDLAGSEKCDAAMSQRDIKETTRINASLTALSKVIFALSKMNGHVPYRDSKLTRLLQDSLGKNTRTVLISTISPTFIGETLNTLQFANRAKRVLVTAKQQENTEQQSHLVGRLKQEIHHLKALLACSQRRNDVSQLRQQLAFLQSENRSLKRQQGPRTLLRHEVRKAPAAPRANLLPPLAKTQRELPKPVQFQQKEYRTVQAPREIARIGERLRRLAELEETRKAQFRETLAQLEAQRAT